MASSRKQNRIARAGKTIFVWLVAVCQWGTLTNARAADTVLIQPDRIALRVGTHSVVATFVERLEQHAPSCSASNALPRDPPGIFGAATMQRIAAAVTCLDGATASPRTYPALTAELWQKLAPDLPLPTLKDRVDALTLSFEATDFADPPIWNFCQDTKSSTDRAAAVIAGATCFNHTDPCSMLTWGPRGATAGQGAELQWVLWNIHRSAPGMIAQAFGNEAAAVRRFVRLVPPNPVACDGTSPLEHFMCAAWIDPERRKAWEQGLVKLSRSAIVQRIYSDIYSAHEFDGYKLESYMSLWRRLSIPPSEIDYAFFIDRATHVGAPPEPALQTEQAIQACMADTKDAKTRHAAARRCLALHHPHATQPIDRLGRDVSYYRMQFADGALTANELTTWDRHIPIDAGAAFGLSDDRPAPANLVQAPLPADARPPRDLTELEHDELSCPLRIRAPERRLPPQ